MKLASPLRRFAASPLRRFAASLLLLSLGGAEGQAASYEPQPAAMRERIQAADVVGEFMVVELRTVILEDGFPTRHVELLPLTPMRGEVERPMLILPGGEVDGVFVRAIREAFEVQVGNRLWLSLAEGAGGEGVCVLHAEPEESALMMVESGPDHVARDLLGRVVMDVDCDGAFLRAEPSTPVEEGVIAGPRSAEDSRTFSDRPEDLGLPWAEVISALRSCGGAR